MDARIGFVVPALFDERFSILAGARRPGLLAGRMIRSAREHALATRRRGCRAEPSTHSNFTKCDHHGWTAVTSLSRGFHPRRRVVLGLLMR